jgi:uncharacterized membrane protein YfcA
MNNNVKGKNEVASTAEAKKKKKQYIRLYSTGATTLIGVFFGQHIKMRLPHRMLKHYLLIMLALISM